MELLLILRGFVKDKYVEKCLFIAVWFGMLSYLLDDFSQYGTHTNFMENEIAEIMENSIRNGRLLRGCLFIPIGLFISKYKDICNIKNGVSLFIVFSIINYCTDNHLLRAAAIAVSACGLFIISMCMNLKYLPIWGILRRSLISFLYVEVERHIRMIRKI